MICRRKNPAYHKIQCHLTLFRLPPLRDCIINLGAILFSDVNIRFDVARIIVHDRVSNF